jgi:hypothetical protein
MSLIERRERERGVKEGAASILCLLPLSTDGRAGRERGVSEVAERGEREEWGRWQSGGREEWGRWQSGEREECGRWQSGERERSEGDGERPHWCQQGAESKAPRET